MGTNTYQMKIRDMQILGPQYSALDLRYLKLDASNDPLTGSLDFASGYGINDIDYIDFDTTATSVNKVGRMRWNNTDRCLEYDSYVDGTMVTNQIGQETWIRARNNTGVDIGNGVPVYVTGATGNRPTIAPARADSEATCLTYIGLTTEIIHNNEDGFVTVRGSVRDVDTNSFTAGDILYVSAVTAGELTNTRPIAPNQAIAVGIVTVKSGSGEIGVDKRIQPNLERLSNVYISSITAGDLLQWDGSDLRWENKSFTTSGMDGRYLMLDQTTPQTVLNGSPIFNAGLVSNGNLVFAGAQKIIGGTGTTSDLTFQTTSGIGTTGADMHFLVGNNGATEAMTILNNGNIGFNSTAPGARLQINTGADATIGQIIKANSATQSGNLTEWHSSGGSALSSVSPLGNFGIGAAPTTYRRLNVDVTVTDPASQYIGARYGGAYTFTVDSAVGNIGQYNIVYASAASGKTASGTQTAASNLVDLYTTNAGTVSQLIGSSDTLVIATNAAGTLSSAVLSSLGASFNTNTATITTLVGLNISIPTSFGGGSVGSIYGIYLNSISGASTNNYSVYTNLGNIRFGDDVILNAADSDKLWFGAGKDMSLYYDGTNGYIKTSEVAASDLHITCGTEKTLVLDTAVYDDVQFDIASGKVPAANFPTWETFTTNTAAYAFSVDDYIDLKANEPYHGWNEGTAGIVHVHFALKTAQSTGANRYAKFTCYVAIADVNGTWTEIGPYTAEATIATGSAALKHYLLDLGTATLTGYHLGMQIKARIKRIAATGGTEYADDVYITQVGIHTQQTRLGSRTASAA